jgi:hypothetical protein
VIASRERFLCQKGYPISSSGYEGLSIPTHTLKPMYVTEQPVIFHHLDDHTTMFIVPQLWSYEARGLVYGASLTEI